MSGQFKKYRPDLPAAPLRILQLPVDKRGYPVPWFVSWVENEPEFRAMDRDKFRRAIKEKRCWVCGELLGINLAFVIGPMCAINKISSEPPSYRECALYSVKGCPFLTKPQMVRRENDLPEGVRDNIAGVGIMRNPGVAMVWVTKSYRVIKVSNGYLLEVGDPIQVLCFAEGREATKKEIEESVRTGLPLLMEAAGADGDDAIKEAGESVVAACALLGISREAVIAK